MKPEAAESKHVRHRRAVRARVIAKLGGECRSCGMNNPLCLEVDHVEPIKRRTNGIGNKDSTTLFRAILRGEATRVQLLCANCHTIKTRLGNEYANGDHGAEFDPVAEFSKSATQTTPTDSVGHVMTALDNPRERDSC